MKKILVMITLALILYQPMESIEVKQVFWVKEVNKSKRTKVKTGKEQSKHIAPQHVIIPLQRDAHIIIPSAYYISPQNTEAFHSPSWKQLMNEEMDIIKKIATLNLLHTCPKKVKVYAGKKDTNPSGLAYIYSSPSFSSNNMYIKSIVGKQYKWLGNQKKDSIFKKNLSIDSIHTWLPVIKPLEDDVKLVLDNQLIHLLDKDNIQYALVKKETNSSNYIIRFFAPNLSTRKNYHQAPCLTKTEKKKNIVSFFMCIVKDRIVHEHALKYQESDIPWCMRTEYHTLCKELREHYTSLANKMIESQSTPLPSKKRQKKVLESISKENRQTHVPKKQYKSIILIPIATCCIAELLCLISLCTHSAKNKKNSSKKIHT